ncbi:hypothetical protein NQ317_015217 [Molorchus minor]|uniref:Uncharacterized protein n=1 Tax=Molorchus minor TaxID=1323400 RepID=A0ABQ9JEG3_9CUCU|nr:hypothetical protein NQ317_015217 [Molorchus minor]
MHPPSLSSQQDMYLYRVCLPHIPSNNILLKIMQFDIEKTGSKLVKVVLKKTCLSGVKNCGISCGSGTDIVLKHNC